MGEIVRDQEEMEIDLLELAGVLWRKVWVIIICFIIGAVMQYQNRPMRTNCQHWSVMFSYFIIFLAITSVKKIFPSSVNFFLESFNQIFVTWFE